MPAKKQSVDMTQGSISGHLIRFAVPMLIGQVFQQLYRGQCTDEQLYQKIADTLTMLQAGGDRT